MGDFALTFLWLVSFTVSWKGLSGAGPVHSSAKMGGASLLQILEPPVVYLPEFCRSPTAPGDLLPLILEWCRQDQEKAGLW